MEFTNIYIVHYFYIIFFSQEITAKEVSRFCKIIDDSKAKHMIFCFSGTLRITA